MTTKTPDHHHRIIKGGINSNDKRESRTSTSLRLRKERKESELISRRQAHFSPGAEDSGVSSVHNAKQSFVSISDVGDEKWLIAGLHNSTNVAPLLTCIRGCRKVLYESSSESMKRSGSGIAMAMSDENAIPSSNTILNSLCSAIPRVVCLLEFSQFPEVQAESAGLLAG
jgi:hypothetical protein